MVVCDLFINIIQCCLLYTQSGPIPAQLKVTKYCVQRKRQRENIDQFELTHRHPILCPCGPSNRIPFSGCVIYLFILFRVVSLVLKLSYVCTSANKVALQNMIKIVVTYTQHNKAQTCANFLNSLSPGKNRRHFVDDVFKCNSLNENVWISINISLKFVPKGPINNIPALVQIMAWRQTGDKPIYEPMMTQFNDAYMRHSASMS